MNFLMKKAMRVFVTTLALATCWVFPALAETVSLAFTGKITEVVSEPPPPFTTVKAGDQWELIYTFDTETLDVDPNELAGQYRDLASQIILTIGDVSAVGAPGWSIPGQISSMVTVNLTDDYSDYTAEASLPNSNGWAQVMLYDNTGTPFIDDSLPEYLPEPLESAFPDFRGFYLRKPNSSEIILKGTIGVADDLPRSFSQVRTDIRVNVQQNYTVVELLVNSALFGQGGFASGMLSCPGCEVMGVEPSPFRWIAESPDGTPANGTAAISIILNPGGEVMGVEPSPFRVFLQSDSQVLGEIDFRGVNGSFPGILGNIDLDGLMLRKAGQSVINIERFDMYDKLDKVIAAGTQADFRAVQGPELSYVAMAVNTNLFGSAGVARGTMSCPGCEVMGIAPSPFRWVVDPATGSPQDGEAVIQFNLNRAGEVMGIEPSPFRILAVSGSTEIGTLDFSKISGHLGSLHITGIRIELADHSYIDVDDLIALEAKIDIDIKPGSEPNIINLKSSGVIPVAILSSLVFDATTIKLETVRLAGASIKSAGKSGKYLAHVQDINGDGLNDLICQVNTNQLVIEPGASSAVLVAETKNGGIVTGQDSIQIISK